MTGFLSVTNWGKYQHYKDRTPIWIKYHVELLHSKKMQALPVPTRLLWDQLLLLAATFQNSIPNSPELIANLTGIPPEECREGIEDLLKGRWLREKKTRRSASKSASLEVRSKSKEKRSARDDGGQDERPTVARLRVVGPGPCPECAIGGGLHAVDCSRSEVA